MIAWMHQQRRSQAHNAARMNGAQGTQNGYQREVVAIYDDAKRTIYLPLGWTGRPPANVLCWYTKWSITCKILPA